MNSMAYFSLNLEFSSLCKGSFKWACWFYLNVFIAGFRSSENTYSCSSVKSKNKSQVSAFSLNIHFSFNAYRSLSTDL